MMESWAGPGNEAKTYSILLRIAAVGPEPYGWNEEVFLRKVMRALCTEQISF